MKNYVLIDIGGTAIKYGIINENQEFLEKSTMKTEAKKGGREILKKAINIVENYKKKYIISGICVSTAGMVNAETGEIFHSGPQIPDYVGVNFKKTMEEKFFIPCEVENDVNCASLAEFSRGAGKNCHSILMLTIGTGIGGAFVNEGKVFHGFSGSACEVGYMNMGGETFQNKASASALGNKVARLKNEPRENWNGYKIFENAKKGDEICIKAIDEMVETLGVGIANICYILNPEAVILGGGIMEQTEYLSPIMEKALKKNLVPAVAEKVNLKFAHFKNDAGMLGAYQNFLLRQEKR